MGDAREPAEERGIGATGQPELVGVDRDAYWEDGLPGQPLTALLFACAQHDEEMTVEYYDPDDPPRCTHGDLMTRKPR